MSAQSLNDEVAFQSHLFWSDCQNLVSKLNRFQYYNLFLDVFQMKPEEAKALESEAQSHVQMI